MNIKGKNHTSIWYENGRIFYIDQTFLPWEVKIREMQNFGDSVRAISDMEVRGAPLIGVAAAFGMYLAAGEGLDLRASAEELRNTRPTAINLAWALDKMLETAMASNKNGELELLEAALDIRESEIERSRKIGEAGLPLIEEIYLKKKKQGGSDNTVNILTHCNAGWLACVEWGTATAPIYMAHDKGIKLHVWVDETRPRNQGAKLTAFELGAHGVPYTLIPDNTGGHLMQNGMVDMALVGTDRTAANGDVANKIGTYLKALAAKDNDIPFYVAMPYSSFDPGTATGRHIPIEERSGDEVRKMQDGRRKTQDVRRKTKDGRGKIGSILIVPEDTPVANYGFDITPARLVTGYITEEGIKDRL